jgi:hypothetical protein
MACIVKEGANVRKADHASAEFCEQPMTQVDPAETFTKRWNWMTEGTIRDVDEACKLSSKQLQGLAPRMR